MLVLITSSLLSIVLLIHFSFTFIYLSPGNTWRSKNWDTIFSYMNPVFTQNWRLFAPNPANQQLNLDMRVHYVDQAGATHETGWRSITQPVIQSLQSNRFSTNARLSELQSSLINDFVWGDKENSQQTFKSLQVYADHVLRMENFIVPGNVNKIQLRAVINTFPRLVDKDKPDSSGKINYYYSKWWNYPTMSNGGGKKT
jgi:hypothetical protein